jgi:RNA polymerase sigma-70 factor (ECF subfamily)
MQTAKQRLFEEQVYVFSNALYNFAAHHLDRQDALDVVQEAFLSAYRSFNRTNKIFNHKSWIFRILINKMKDHYRKSSRTSSLEFEDGLSDHAMDMSHIYSCYSLNPLPEVISLELAQEVQKVVDNLPVTLKMPFFLSLEGFSYQEMADIMECPIGTIMSRLHQCRKILRDSLIDFL